MTAPYADLIERLREMGAADPWDARLGEAPLNPDGPEAANAIEALQAEVERWIEAYRIAHDQATENGARANSLQAEVTRLLTAFEGLDITTPPEGEG